MKTMQLDFFPFRKMQFFERCPGLRAIFKFWSQTDLVHSELELASNLATAIGKRESAKSCPVHPVAPRRMTGLLARRANEGRLALLRMSGIVAVA